MTNSFFASFEDTKYYGTYTWSDEADSLEDFIKQVIEYSPPYPIIFTEVLMDEKPINLNGNNILDTQGTRK